MFELTGRTALVTGASGGIGGAVAKALHSQGAEIMLSGTRGMALAALAGESANARISRLATPGAEAADRLVKQAEAAMGHLDILVNNAGLTRDGLVLGMKDEDWQAVIEVDLTAAFRLTRAALRGLARRRHGRIIGVTSVVAPTGTADRPTTPPPRRR